MPPGGVSSSKFCTTMAKWAKRIESHTNTNTSALRRLHNGGGANCGCGIDRFKVPPNWYLPVGIYFVHVMHHLHYPIAALQLSEQPLELPTTATLSLSNHQPQQTVHLISLF